MGGRKPGLSSETLHGFTETGRSPDSRHASSVPSPQSEWCSLSHRSQWRDRAGFSPASLFNPSWDTCFRRYFLGPDRIRASGHVSIEITRRSEKGSQYPVPKVFSLMFCPQAGRVPSPITPPCPKSCSAARVPHPRPLRSASRFQAQRIRETRVAGDPRSLRATVRHPCHRATARGGGPHRRHPRQQDKEPLGQDTR